MSPSMDETGAGIAEHTPSPMTPFFRFIEEHLPVDIDTADAATALLLGLQIARHAPEWAMAKLADVEGMATTPGYPPQQVLNDFDEMVRRYPA